MSKHAPHAQSPRLVAATVLKRYDSVCKQMRSGAQAVYAATILNDFIDNTNQPQKATDLVMGTLRNRFAIDHLLAVVADTPAKRIAPSVINIVRIGVYELVFRPKTANYSIINEAVENTKTLTGKKQAGFVNAVLRKISARIKDRSTTIEPEHIRSTLPQFDNTGCRFNRWFLPDPLKKPAEYFSAAYSLPNWLVAGWLGQYGPDKTMQICRASNRRPGIYLRPNSTKTTTYALAEKLTAAGYRPIITEDESMIKISSTGKITKVPGYMEGLFSVQDAAASQVVRAVDIRPGDKILDLCAAPGTKTTQLAEITDGNAPIFATDIDAERLSRINHSTQRLGLMDINVFDYEKLDQCYQQAGPFDIVLIDVPCSNTGVLAKRPEVRLRLKSKSIDKLIVTQLEILEMAAHLVAPGGRICYSTCSIETIENRGRVDAFLYRYPEFELVEDKLTLPQAGRLDHDGAYHAIIVKKK